MAINEDGDFVVALNYYRHTFYDHCTLVNIVIYARLFTNEGDHLGSEIQITKEDYYNNQFNPSVVFKDSIFIVSWYNDLIGTILLQRFNKDGDPLHEDMRCMEDAKDINRGKLPVLYMIVDVAYIIACPCISAVYA